MFWHNGKPALGLPRASGQTFPNKVEVRVCVDSVWRRGSGGTKKVSVDRVGVSVDMEGWGGLSRGCLNREVLWIQEGQCRQESPCTPRRVEGRRPGFTGLAVVLQRFGQFLLLTVAGVS